MSVTAESVAECAIDGRLLKSGIENSIASSKFIASSKLIIDDLSGEDETTDGNEAPTGMVAACFNDGLSGSMIASLVVNDK
jgi:hypothetical protein